MKQLFYEKVCFLGAKLEDLLMDQNIFAYLMVPPGNAELWTSHVSPFLLNLAGSLIILAFSKLQLLCIRKKKAFKNEIYFRCHFFVKIMTPTQFSFSRYGKTVIATELSLGNFSFYRRCNIIYECYKEIERVGPELFPNIVHFIWFDPAVMEQNLSSSYISTAPKMVRSYIMQDSNTPRTFRAWGSQSEFRIFNIRESSARALHLYNCTLYTFTRIGTIHLLFW